MLFINCNGVFLCLYLKSHSHFQKARAATDTTHKELRQFKTIYYLIDLDLKYEQNLSYIEFFDFKFENILEFCRFFT